jgi:hypothetical protein
MPTFSEINSAIQKCCRECKHPGVIAFGSGYEFTGDRITDKSAIVAIVDGKRDDIRQRAANGFDGGGSGQPWCNLDHRICRLGAHGGTKVAL